MKSFTSAIVLMISLLSFQVSAQGVYDKSGRSKNAYDKVCTRVQACPDCPITDWICNGKKVSQARRSEERGKLVRGTGKGVLT